MKGLLLGVIGLAVLAAPPNRQDSPLPTVAGFPPADASIAGYQRRGLVAKEAARRLSAKDDSVETLAILLEANDVTDAFSLAARLLLSPARIERTATQLRRRAISLLTDRTKNYQEQLAALIEPARVRLAQLPREDAARAARALFDLEGDLRRGGPSASYEDRLQEFIREYPGSEAATIAQVDLIDAGPVTPTQLARLAEYAETHPGTVAGAKALYLQGYHLAHNLGSPPYAPRGSDPTDRLMKTTDVVARLESGSWPACEWVENAVSLVAGFFSFEPKFSPSNLDRAIDVYKTFAARHLASAPRPLRGSHIDYIIETKLGDLYRMKGDAAGVERTLTEFEKLVSDPAEVRLQKALYLKSPALLAEIADEPVPQAPLALATLASMQFGARDYANAIGTYLRYLARYPQSDWAWVAAIRIGQAQADSGDGLAAAAILEAAAARYATNSYAQMVAFTLAARAHDAAAQADAAIADYQHAVDAWDDDYTWDRPAGMTLQFDAASSRTQADAPAPLRLVGVTRQALVDRTAALTELKRSPSGNLARALEHRARLERALDAADARDLRRDESGAMHALEDLEREPIDFYVIAAKFIRGIVRARQQPGSDAERLIQEALQALSARRAAGGVYPVGSLEADVVAIRNEVFLPTGQGILSTHAWGGYKWPASPPTFMVMKTVFAVKAFGSPSRVVIVDQPIPEKSGVIFLSPEELEFLANAMPRLGEVGPLLARFLGERRGHWGTWEFETFPLITRIEFLDSQRTRAAAAVSVGFSGVTIVLEKRDRVWRAIGLTNEWIS
jgi:hypothetical protein